MVKPLEPGMKFLVPLKGGGFLPGYVSAYGNMFTLVNIFDNVQSKREAPTSFPEDRILFRDWLIGDHVFSRSKRAIETPWILYRENRVENPLTPRIEGIIIGESGREKVESLSTGETIRTATREDLRRLPKHEIESARYYSLSVEAQLQGRNVEFDPISREFYIK